MANRAWNEPGKTLDVGMIYLDGYVNLNSNGTVAVDTLPGGTVSHTGTGTYLIQLDDAYTHLRACNITLMFPTAVDLVPQIVSRDVTGLKQIVFKLLAGSTATDPAQTGGIYIHLALKNSSV